MPQEKTIYYFKKALSTTLNLKIVKLAKAVVHCVSNLQDCQVFAFAGIIAIFKLT